MSGDIVVASDRIEQQFYFTRQFDSACDGWFEVWCNRCDSSTTGAESVVEEWAYEHRCRGVDMTLTAQVGTPPRELVVKEVVCIRPDPKRSRVFIHRRNGTMYSTTNIENATVLAYYTQCSEQGVETRVLVDLMEGI